MSTLSNPETMSTNNRGIHTLTTEERRDLWEQYQQELAGEYGFGAPERWARQSLKNRNFIGFLVSRGFSLSGTAATGCTVDPESELVPYLLTVGAKDETLLAAHALTRLALPAREIPAKYGQPGAMSTYRFSDEATSDEIEAESLEDAVGKYLTRYDTAEMEAGETFVARVFFGEDESERASVTVSADGKSGVAAWEINR